MPGEIDEELGQLLHDLDEMSELLSDPVRSAVLEILRARGRATTAELVQAIDTSRSSVQRALRKLLDGGRIVRQGRRGTYELSARFPGGSL